LRQRKGKRIKSIRREMTDERHNLNAALRMVFLTVRGRGVHVVTEGCRIKKMIGPVCECGGVAPCA
jgi:hypothetical protein